MKLDIEMERETGSPVGNQSLLPMHTWKQETA